MKKKDNTLTKVEFQVMSILWDINHSACAWDIIERWDHSRTARCARESDSYCCLHIAIFLNSSDTGYNLLVLDTKGDLWLPKEWPIMKSWKNGKVVYREKRNAEDSRKLGGLGWTSISHGDKPWTELEKPQKKDKKKSVQSL